MKTFATLALAAGLGLAATGAQAAYSYCAAVDAEGKRAYLTDVTETAATDQTDTLLANFDDLLKARGIAHTARLCAVGEHRDAVLKSARSVFWNYSDAGMSITPIFP